MKSLPKVIACCRASVREADILRLWLQFYAPHVESLAVVIIAEGGEDISAARDLCEGIGAHFEIHRAERFVPSESVAALGRLVESIEADWLLHADSDEFLYEADELPEILRTMDKERADYAVAWMADRLAFGGRLRGLEGVNSFEELDARFPVRSAITGELAKGCAYKVCLTRWPHTGAIHDPTPPLKQKFARRLTLEHFKWRTGLEERLGKRIKDHAASRLPWGIESERILNELATFGRIRAECWIAPRSRRIYGGSECEDIYLDAVNRAREGGQLVVTGVRDGRSLCFLAEAALAVGKTLRIHGVDAFQEFPESSTGSRWGQGELATKQSAKGAIAANLRKAGMLDYVNLVQAESPEAARMFGDQSLDFVWIDGDRSPESVGAEIRAWWPRVISGGAVGVRASSKSDRARALNGMIFSDVTIIEQSEALLLRKAGGN